jgi:hypothetical protein
MVKPAGNQGLTCVRDRNGGSGLRTMHTSVGKVPWRQKSEPVLQAGEPHSTQVSPDVSVCTRSARPSFTTNRSIPDQSTRVKPVRLLPLTRLSRGLLAGAANNVHSATSGSIPAVFVLSSVNRHAFSTLLQTPIIERLQLFLLHSVAVLTSSGARCVWSVRRLDRSFAKVPSPVRLPAEIRTSAFISLVVPPAAHIDSSIG